jgi:hypothetical protein
VCIGFVLYLQMVALVVFMSTVVTVVVCSVSVVVVIRVGCTACDWCCDGWVGGRMLVLRWCACGLSMEIVVVCGWGCACRCGIVDMVGCCGVVDVLVAVTAGCCSVVL